MTLQKTKGNKGENSAVNYLHELGYKILQTNYHSRYGEIDIIAQDRDTLVFVEVKNFKSQSLVSPYQSITKGKQAKIIKTARYYLMANNLVDIPARFDVIFFEDSKLKEHLEGAFFI